MSSSILSVEINTPPTIIHEAIQGVQGPQGIQGSQGVQGERGYVGSSGGDSAYTIALANGFVGTEEAWLLSLKGDKGDTGDTGATGATGARGTTDYNELTNKPTLFTVATTGSYLDLSDKPVIPDAQVQTDWNATTGVGSIANKPTLSAVATTGSYNSLTNKPALTSTIAGALDADITSPANNQVLKYNSGTGKWVNATLSGGSLVFSAYDVAVMEGFVGDEAAWLASLVGATGLAGEAGSVIRQGGSNPNLGSLIGSVGFPYIDTFSGLVYDWDNNSGWVERPNFIIQSIADNPLNIVSSSPYYLDYDERILQLDHLHYEYPPVEGVDGQYLLFRRSWVSGIGNSQSYVFHDKRTNGVWGSPIVTAGTADYDTGIYFGIGSPISPITAKAGDLFLDAASNILYYDFRNGAYNGSMYLKGTNGVNGTNGNKIWTLPFDPWTYTTPTNVDGVYQLLNTRNGEIYYCTNQGWFDYLPDSNGNPIATPRVDRVLSEFQYNPTNNNIDAILSLDHAPLPVDGVDGDFAFFETTEFGQPARKLYGPKTAGVWDVYALYTVNASNLIGEYIPEPQIGRVDDYCINTVTGVMFGPRRGEGYNYEGYPSVSLKGEAGTTDWNDLTNKPTIPTNTSDLSNDMGYLVASNVAIAITDAIVGKANTADLSAVALSNSYLDLNNNPTLVSSFTNDSGYQIASDVTTAIAGKANTSSLATVATSGSYEDLIAKPTIPTVPTTLSSFTNDSGYQIASDITTAIAGKANTSSLATVATSGSYEDLSDKPTFTATLAGSTDVTITTPTNNQALTYDSATSKWKNTTPSASIPSYPDILGGLRSAGVGAVATNVALGQNALIGHSTSGGNDVAIGESTLLADYATVDNVTIGANAGQNLISGISGYTVVAGGAGYTASATGTVSAPASGGVQATATLMVSGGTILLVSTAVNGKKYDTSATITINPIGGGSGANVTPVVSSGSQNVAVGSQALKTGISCIDQVAVGYKALTLCTNSNAPNTAVGSKSLVSLTSGSGNTAVGYNAGSSIVTSTNTVTIGVGAGASAGTYGTFVGASSGTNTSAANVTCVGYYSGAFAGAQTTYVGYGAGQFNSGTNNTGIGVSTFAASGTGAYNTSVGYESSKAITTGSYNVAIGDSASKAVTTSSNNVAIGYQALFTATANTSKNVAVGYQALKVATGTGTESNVAIGYQAGVAVTFGGANTIVGTSAGIALTTGGSNTLIGHGAGSALVDGENVTCIGMNSAASSTGASNQMTFGNSNITLLRSAVTTITSTSDSRDKTDIAPLPVGLNFVNDLSPVFFTWNMRKLIGDETKQGIKSAGFLAQDLDALQTKYDAVENLDLVSKDNPDRLEARYGNLIPVLVKAIQDLSAQNVQLLERIEKLECLL